MSSLKYPFLKTTFYGLVALGFVEGLTSYIIPEWIRNFSACYKDALQSLRDHPEAVKILGEPIIEKRMSFTGSNDNSSNESYVWYTVPVEGSKSSGKLRYWLTVDTVEDKTFKVVRVELAPNDSSDKVLLIKSVIE